MRKKIKIQVYNSKQKRNKSKKKSEISKWNKKWQRIYEEENMKIKSEILKKYKLLINRREETM